VVATPIGHLSDLSPRAAEVLRTVDVVAAEDTRVTRVLLAHVGSKARLTSAHAHNERAAAEAVLGHLREGRSVALVSDAGTPAISDPGGRIVAAVHAAGWPVVPVPGPSALAALLSAAGLAEGPFLFEGFLPSKASARAARLAVLAQAADRAGAALVLYESPHRIEATLAAIAERFGAGRLVVVGRELTKTFEEVHRCAAGEATAWLHAKPERLRGEFAIAIERAPAPADAEAATDVPAWARDPAALLARLIEDLPPSRAVRLAQALTGRPHRELYALALAARGASAAKPSRRRTAAGEATTGD